MVCKAACPLLSKLCQKVCDLFGSKKSATCHPPQEGNELDLVSKRDVTSHSTPFRQTRASKRSVAWVQEQRLLNSALPAHQRVVRVPLEDQSSLPSNHGSSRSFNRNSSSSCSVPATTREAIWEHACSTPPSDINGIRLKKPQVNTLPHRRREVASTTTTMGGSVKETKWRKERATGKTRAHEMDITCHF